MVHLRNCHLHALPASLLCPQQHQTIPLCAQCLPLCSNPSHPQLAIGLNPTTITYFTLLTHKVASAAVGWAQLLREGRTGEVLEVRTTEGGVWECRGKERMVDGLGARVMQEHAELMRNNEHYVTSNQESEGLYHPQCLRDIYNLAALPWQDNAHIIIEKMERLLWENCQEECRKARPVVNLRPARIIQIQSYREELLGKWREDIFTDLRGLSLGKSSGSEETIGSQGSAKVLREGKEVSQFQVVQAVLGIKQVQSYEQIQDNHQETTRREQQLISQNRQLREQNSSLKCENVLFKQDCSILRDKCMQLQSQRRQQSSSKKRSEVSLHSQLLSEIVQLQSQLNDSNHDLHLLITFLNQLSKRNIIAPLELRQRLLPLKTVTLH